MGPFSDYKPSTLPAHRAPHCDPPARQPARLSQYLPGRGCERRPWPTISGSLEFFPRPLRVFQYLRTTLFPISCGIAARARFSASGRQAAPPARRPTARHAPYAPPGGFHHSARSSPPTQQKNLDVAARGVHGPRNHGPSAGGPCASAGWRWMAKVTGGGARTSWRNVVVRPPQPACRSPFTRVDLVVCRNLLIYLKAHRPAPGAVATPFRPAAGPSLLGSEAKRGRRPGGAAREAIETGLAEVPQTGQGQPAPNRFPGRRRPGHADVVRASGRGDRPPTSARLTFSSKRRLPPGMLVDGDRRVPTGLATWGCSSQKHRKAASGDVLQLVHESLRSASAWPCTGGRKPTVRRWQVTSSGSWPTATGRSRERRPSFRRPFPLGPFPVAFPWPARWRSPGGGDRTRPQPALKSNCRPCTNACPEYRELGEQRAPRPWPTTGAHRLQRTAPA